MAISKKIKVYGNTDVQYAYGPLTSRSEYECANADITRGNTGAPTSFDECYEKFPQIEEIANQLLFQQTFTNPNNDPIFLSASATGPDGAIGIIKDLYTGITSSECTEAESQLGSDWLGCLWGSPMAPFSCSCPYVGEKFEAYLKLRLNVASFWKTPIKVPVERKSFFDELKYNTKIELTVAGDFNLTPGDVVEIRVDHPTRYGNDTPARSLFSGTYMVLSVKHVLTSSGTHETALTISALPNKN